jgi:hypothetical protein
VGPNRVFYNAWGLLVSYPAAWAPALAFAAAAGVILLTASVLRSGKATAGGVVVSAVMVGVATVAVTALVAGVWEVLKRLHPDYQLPYGHDLRNGREYLIAVIAAAVVLTGTASSWILRRRSQLDVLLGALLLWTLLAIWLSIAFPGASYVGLLPAVSGLASAAFIMRGHPAATAVLAAPPIALATYLLAALYLGLGTDSLPIAAALVSLIAWLLFPMEKEGGKRWLLPGGGTVALAALVLAEFHAGFDAGHPRPTSIFYGLDANSGKAVWATRANRTDARTVHFLGSEPRRTTLPKIAGWLGSDELFLQSPASAIHVSPPALEVLDDRQLDGERQVSLWVHSEREADGLIFIVSGDRAVRVVELEGRVPSDPLDSGHASTVYQCVFFRGLSPTGFHVTVRLQGGGPLQVRLIDRTLGLPATTGSAITWPDGMMRSAEIDFLNETTLVTRHFEI